MLEITIGIDPATRTDITIPSSSVAAIVSPCSAFEQQTLRKLLQTQYGFEEADLRQPRMVCPVLVDWVTFLGQPQSIYVKLWCWRVKTVWLCFVEPSSDMFSFGLVESWLREHFDCKDDRGVFALYEPENFWNCVRVLQAAIARTQADKLLQRS